MIEGEINWGDEEVRKRSMGDKEARGENPWEIKRSIGEIKR